MDAVHYNMLSDIALRRLSWVPRVRVAGEGPEFEVALPGDMAPTKKYPLGNNTSHYSDFGVHCSLMKDDGIPSPPVQTPKKRRPTGQVRRGLIDAGIALARAGGPDAVMLREAARTVGVAPNAAYRHFADRDALLYAVCVEAMQQLAHQMEAAVSRVESGYGTHRGAMARLTAIGVTYIDFALSEPGLFETAFAVPSHMEYATGNDATGPGGRTPFQLLRETLDELADAQILPHERRPQAEYVVWASVHGLAMLVSQGPLRQLPPSTTSHLIDLLNGFIIRGL